MEPDCTPCVICLETVNKDQGSLDTCSHIFCFYCIQQWSEVTNRCPYCHSKFNTIIRKKISNEIINKTQDPKEVEILESRLVVHDKEQNDVGLEDIFSLWLEDL